MKKKISLEEAYKNVMSKKKKNTVRSIKKNIVYKSSSISDIYKEYKSRYQQKEAIIKQKYGADMYASMSPNEMNFEMLYEGIKNENPNLSAGEIIDRIVNRQSSKMTWSSASRLASNISDIQRAMYDPTYMMDEIDDAYWKMRDDGLAGAVAGRFISNFYFGSE